MSLSERLFTEEPVALLALGAHDVAFAATFASLVTSGPIDPLLGAGDSLLGAKEEEEEEEEEEEDDEDDEEEEEEEDEDLDDLDDEEDDEWDDDGDDDDLDDWDE
jgi:hypothetical protein